MGRKVDKGVETEKDGEGEGGKEKEKQQFPVFSGRLMEICICRELRTDSTGLRTAGI